MGDQTTSRTQKEKNWCLKRWPPRSSGENSTHAPPETISWSAGAGLGSGEQIKAFFSDDGYASTVRRIQLLDGILTNPALTQRRSWKAPKQSIENVEEEKL